MSRKTYGGSNINWGSFDEWSNQYTTDSNVNMSSAMSDMYPGKVSPFSASQLANSTIFRGTVRAQTGGTVAITSPYTIAATSGNIVLKNIYLNSYNITIVATATYPWTFSAWRSGAGATGDVISASATFTITNSANADYANYYAYFTTTHLNPYA